MAAMSGDKWCDSRERPAPLQNTMADEVRVYLTERLIDGNRYAEQVCARSWQEAEALAGASGARVIGELKAQMCARCGLQTDGASEVDKTPTLGPDEWPDEIKL